MSKLAIAYAMKKKAKKMAEGGFVGEEKASGYLPESKEIVKHNGPAMSEDDRMLNQHGEEEEGPYGAYAEGGQITDNKESAAHELDMVGRIMKQRQRMYSKGGEVANDTPPMADSESDDFDYMAQHDGLESSYSGANSGDELGDAQEDHDRADIVARVMKSRRLKDKMPRPA